MPLTKTLNGVTYDVGSPEYNQAFGIDPVATYGKSPISRSRPQSMWSGDGNAQQQQSYYDPGSTYSYNSSGQLVNGFGQPYGGNTGGIGSSAAMQPSLQAQQAYQYTQPYDPSKANTMYSWNGSSYVPDPNGVYKYQQGIGGSGGYLNTTSASFGGAGNGSTSPWFNAKAVNPTTNQYGNTPTNNQAGSNTGSTSQPGQGNFGYPTQPQYNPYQGGFGYNPYTNPNPNPYGAAGQMGNNGFSQLAQYLMQLTGYAPTDFLNQTGDQSLNVLGLNSLMNPAAGQGLSNNYGGAGGGLPDYFGNGYGVGISGYEQQFNPQDLQSSLGDFANFGGIGGSLTQRLNQLYNGYDTYGVPNLYADYLEFAAPRMAQGWNLYGASPALEGLMAQPNTNPYNYNQNWGGGGVQPLATGFETANAWPMGKSAWEENGNLWKYLNPLDPSKGMGGTNLGGIDPVTGKWKFNPNIPAT